MAVTIKRGRRREGGGELPVAPMIDVVFLLLVYFMVSASIQKQEADIRFSLPAVVKSSEPVSFPDEQIIEIDAAGRPWVNGYAYDAPESSRFERLEAMLGRFRASAEASGSAARISIAPSDEARHEQVVRVMDACAAAGIASVNFVATGP